VARVQGNYATLAQISTDVRRKTGGGTVGLVSPILSRNRFSLLLKGISQGVDNLVIILPYPKDEVGNALFDSDLIDQLGVNPYSDVFEGDEIYSKFGKIEHPFTGIDYIALYKEYAPNCKIILANNFCEVLKYTDKVICADIHTRAHTKKILKNSGASLVLGLDDILTDSVDGSGYNKDFGLLGSNISTDDSVKLFPRDCLPVVDKVAELLFQQTGKHIEVMIYGDGAFKDPVGGIWELADPMVSPAYTSGLVGTPNEVKIKFLADNSIGNLSGDLAKNAIVDLIKHKNSNLFGKKESLGTTPRRLTDLLGSLCDLTSGSGDKGTPVILIQNYFSNYADD
ncbi:MAG: coenzyme F420-0:L-glutamate ligase, partial [Clostridia bacterium]